MAAGAAISGALGPAAGAPGGARATLPLVPAMADLAAISGRDIPVVAAGGIADGRGLAAALMLGADGVLMGTRFYASEESLAPAAAKARLVGGSGDDTLRTTVFDVARDLDWPAGFTARALANRFSETWHGREAELSRVAMEEQRRYAEAAAAGDFDTAVVFAGEGADLIHTVEPAALIVARVVAEAEVALARRFD
jgi:nitronate monooxygenase